MLLDLVQWKNIWVSSLASAIGIRYEHAQWLLKGMILPTEIQVSRLEGVFPKLPWRECLEAYSQAPTDQRFEIPEDLDDQNQVYTQDDVLAIDRKIYQGQISDASVVSGWLQNHQVFTLEAFMYTFDLEPIRADRKTALMLYQYHYYPRQERHGKTRHRVWRWDPLRLCRKV